MRRESAGYGLMELLAAVLVLSIAMAAVVVVFATHSRAYLRADAQSTMEANLRLGMNMVTESLRNGKYGVPTANLSSWTTWVSGFTNNPTITTNDDRMLSVVWQDNHLWGAFNVKCTPPGDSTTRRASATSRSRPAATRALPPTRTSA